MKLTRNLLRHLIDYDPESGEMRWRSRSPFMFWGNNPELTCAQWNTRYAGQPALTCKDKDGYFHGCILGRQVKAHRLAWIMVHGEEPDIIDHINHDRSDNRIANLRNVDSAGNRRNVRLPATNSSGVVGVRRHRTRWQARIKVSGREIHLGNYDSFEDACAARRAAAQAYGFHANHGGL